MTSKLLLRSAAIAALSVSALAQARAESAREFLRNEYQRQQPFAQQRPVDIRPSGALAYARGNWSPQPLFGRSFGYSEWPPAREDRPRAMPQAHVDNPDFLIYTPDRLQTKSLAKACQFEIGANGEGAPTFAFAQACMATPAVSMRVLPEVGDAVAAYYSAHPDFLWVQDGKIGPRALAAIAELGAADKYGLDPPDYRVDIPQLPADGPAREQALLRFEFALSARTLTYVLDATRGRIDPNRISGYHDLPRKSVDLVAALGELAKSADVAAALAARNPDNPQFRTLVAELARLRGQAQPKAAPIAPNTSIRPGENAAQLPNVVADLKLAASPALRQKYAAALAQAGTHYTGDLVEAVRAFQREKGLPADGFIGKKTIVALTGGDGAGTADKIEKVKLALERLRWLPRQLGNPYVFLNEPAYEVSYVENGKKPLTMRAVVGKPNAQTYFFVDRVKDVEYNPYWNVPRSIVINEMLPRLYRDPSWLDQRGYEVSDQRGRQIASNSVNWAAVATDKTSIDVRQPPGDRNALGRVKIEFPNKHAIYLHDTNEKNLFSREQRALSHGCVRLQYPREMAAAVLGVSVDHVDQRIASRNTDKDFVKRDVPIYLAYFTAWPDAEGKVRYFADVYDRDAHLQLALAKTEAARQGD